MWGFERLAWFTERSGTYACRGSALLARSLFRLSGGVMLRSLSVAPYACPDRRPRARIVVPAAMCLAGDRKDFPSLLPTGRRRQPLTGSHTQNVIGVKSGDSVDASRSPTGVEDGRVLVER